MDSRRIITIIIAIFFIIFWIAAFAVFIYLSPGFICYSGIFLSKEYAQDRGERS